MFNILIIHVKHGIISIRLEGFMKRAFTLAEVLITLGIIGVVAAMTLPGVIQSYRNSVAEVRLKKFYTVFNEAILRAEAKHGDRLSWYLDSMSVEVDDNGNVVEGSSSIDNWFKTYLNDFIVIKKTVHTSGRVLYYLPDGSAFQFGTSNGVSSRGITYYIGNPEKCPEADVPTFGVCCFYFMYWPTYNSIYYYRKGLEPSKYDWDGNISSLYRGASRSCDTGDGAYCSALIQVNGWKIPKDYPRKIRF